MTQPALDFDRPRPRTEVPPVATAPSKRAAGKVHHWPREPPDGPLEDAPDWAGCIRRGPLGPYELNAMEEVF